MSFDWSAYNRAVGKQTSPNKGPSKNDRTDMWRRYRENTGTTLPSLDLAELPELPAAPSPYADWTGKRAGVDARGVDLDAGLLDLERRDSGLSSLQQYIEIAESNLDKLERRAGLTGAQEDIDAWTAAFEPYKAAVERYNQEAGNFNRLQGIYNDEARLQGMTPKQMQDSINENIRRLEKEADPARISAIRRENENMTRRITELQRQQESAAVILEDAYKRENELQRQLSSAEGRELRRGGDAQKVLQLRRELEEVQAQITELGGKANAKWGQGAVQGYFGSMQEGIGLLVKGEDNRQQESDIRAGEAALAEALENAIMAEAAGQGNPAETARLRQIVSAINQPGADKEALLAEFLPGLGTVTDEVAERNELYEAGRQAMEAEGKELRTKGAENIEAAKAGRSEAGKVLVDLGVQGIHMGLDAAIGAVTMLGGTVPLALRSFGGAAGAAKDDGASDAQAIGYGIASAAVEVLAEKLLDGVAGIYGKGRADDMVDHFIGKLAKTDTGRKAWQLLFASLGEGTEEALADAVDPILQTIYKEQSVWENFGELEAADVAYDFFIGAVMGFFGGGIDAVSEPSASTQFFYDAAESGLSFKTAVQTWAKLTEDFSEAERAKQMAKVDSMADRIVAQQVQSRIDAERAEAQKEADKQYFEKYTTRAQANKIVHDEALKAEWLAKTGAELKGAYGDQAREVMRVSQERLDTLNAPTVSETERVEATETTTQAAEQTAETVGVANNAMATEAAETAQETTAPKTAMEMPETRNADRAPQGQRNDARSAQQTIEILRGRDTDTAHYGGVEYSVYYDVDGTYTARAMRGEETLWTESGLESRTAAVNALQGARESGSIAGVGSGTPGLVRNQTFDKLRGEKKLTSKTARELDYLARVLGAEIAIEESITDGEGNSVNASYANGRISIAVDADDPVTVAAVHEAVHSLKQSDEAAFRDLAGAVFRILANESRSFAADFQRTAQLYGWVDETGTYTENGRADTLEEMVAQGMGIIAQHGDVLARMTEQDRGVIQRVIDAINDIVEKIRGYTDYDADKRINRSDAETYRTLLNHMEDLQGKLEAALQNGGDTITARAMETMGAETEAEQTPVTAEEEAKLSKKNDGKIMDRADEYNAEHGAVDQAVMDKAREQRAAVREMLNDEKLRDMLPEDIEGDTIYGNSSYSKSAENSTVCPRSLVLDELANAVSTALGRPLTFNEALYVTQMSANYTDKPECAYCYVAADRKVYTDMLGRYIQQRNAAVQAHREGESIDWIVKNILGINPGDKKRDNDKMRNRVKTWLRMADANAAFITEADLAGFGNYAEDIKARRAQLAPELRAEFDLATRYAQSAARAKVRVKYAAYDGKILKMSPATVSKLNGMYGLRMYSFTDYSPAFLLENMQMFTDAAVRGLKVLAYTKEMDFAEIFAPTGANINISIHGMKSPDANGEFHMDAMQGADWERAKALRAQHPNVGITFVAESDAAVEWAMRQDWIDVVIPFHSVFGGGNLAAEIYGWKNYKQFQEDKKDSDLWKKGNAKSIYPTEHNNDLIQYADALIKNGLTPRFPQWCRGFDLYREGEIDAEEFRSLNPNYMKLVNECRRAAKDTPAVQPVFDVSRAEAGIDEMIRRGGFYEQIGGSSENMQEIAGEIAGEIQQGKAEEMAAAKRFEKWSRKQATPDEDYLAAVGRGDEETAQRMLDEAAKAAGYNIKLHHGTAGEPFYIFRQGEEGIHFGTLNQALDRAESASVRYISEIEGYTIAEIRKNLGMFSDRARREIIDKISSELSVELTEGEKDFAYRIWVDDEDISDETLIRFIDKVEDEETSIALSNYAMQKNDGKRVISAYVKAQNPLVFNVDIGRWTPYEIADLFIKKINGETAEIYDYEAGEWVKYNPAEITDIALTEDDLPELEILSQSRDFSDMAKFLQNRGYDSVRYLNNYEGNKNEESYILLSPEQVKSAELLTSSPVTGEIIPLSERFNEETPDIRYSRKQGNEPEIRPIASEDELTWQERRNLAKKNAPSREKELLEVREKLTAGEAIEHEVNYPGSETTVFMKVDKNSGEVIIDWSFDPHGTRNKKIEPQRRQIAKSIPEALREIEKAYENYDLIESDSLGLVAYSDGDDKIFEGKLQAEDRAEFAAREGTDRDIITNSTIDERRLSREEAMEIAERDGYPLIRDANGNDVQVLPEYTWVQSKERGNYGLVTSAEIGADGLPVLNVWFANKARGTAMSVALRPDEVIAVEGEMQLGRPEYTEADAPPEADNEPYPDMWLPSEEEYERQRRLQESREETRREYERMTADELTQQIADQMPRQHRPESGTDISNLKLQERQRRDAEGRRLLQERAARTESRSAFEGTDEMKAAGIKVSGSLVQNWAMVKQLLQRRQAEKSVEREYNQMLRRYNLRPSSPEVQFAKGIANGTYSADDIPQRYNSNIVRDVVDMERVRASMRQETLAEVKRGIKDRERQKAAMIFADSEKYRPDPHKGISKNIMNERTPERVLRSIYGPEKGAQIFNYLFRPVQENNAEAIRWVNKQKADVQLRFVDKTGKQRELTKAEKAYAQHVREGEGFAWQAAKLEGYDLDTYDAHMANFRQLMQLMTREGYSEVIELVDAVNRGDMSRQLAEERTGNPELFREVLANRQAAISLPDMDSDLRKIVEGMQWYQQIEREIQSNKEVDAQIIDNAADAIGEKYDEYYRIINQFLIAHGHDEIGFIPGYAPHMQPEPQRKAWGAALSSLGIQLDEVSSLPAAIAGRTADFKPNMRWNPHFQHRRGGDTDYNIVKGFESYLKFMADILYHTDDIMRLRQTVDYFRGTYASEEIAANLSAANAIRYAPLEDKINFLQGRMPESYVPMYSTEVDNLIDQYVESQYADAGNLTKYSEFVTWLENYANMLAGKQSLADRGLEYTGGRKMLNVSNKLMRAFQRANVAGSMSSVLNQAAQLPMITTHLGPKYGAQALADIISGEARKADWKNRSDFLVGKEGVDRMEASNFDKFIDVLFSPARGMDRIISTMAVRGEYLRQLDQGVSDEIAMRRADDYGRKVMGSRVRGERPQGFESKRFFAQMAHVFQTEAANQFDYVVSDMPQAIRDLVEREGKAAAAKKVAAVVTSYLLQAFLINRIGEELYGGTPAPFDLAGMAAEFAASGRDMSTERWLLMVIDNGMEAMGGDRVFGTDEDEAAERFNWANAMESAAYTVSNDLPFVRNLAGIAGLGDQSLPTVGINEMAQGLRGIWQGTMGEDERFGGGDADWGEIYRSGLDVVAQAVPGGRQLKKSATGLAMMAQGGSYSGDRLRYPVEGGFAKWLQAGLFGTSALDETDEYYATHAKNLTEQQTFVYKALVADGMGRQDAYDAIQKYREIDSDKTLTSLERDIGRREFITNLPISNEAKLETWLDLVLDGEETSKYQTARELMDMGLQWQHIAAAMDEQKRIDEGDGKASSKATAFAAWVDDYAADHWLPEEAAEKMKDGLAYWSMVKQEAGTYENLRGAGLSADKAQSIADMWANLRPEEGKKSVSELQKMYAMSAATYLSDKERYDATAMALLDDTSMETESGEASQYAKLLWCQETGLAYDDYVDAKNAGAIDNLYRFGTEAGADAESAYTMAMAVAELEPEPGAKSISSGQKYEAIGRTDVDEIYKLAVMEEWMSETAFKRLELTMAAGVSIELYGQALQIRTQYDADGNGSYKHAEIEAAVDSMPISQQQKAALWSALTSSVSKNNPFDRSFGRKYYTDYYAWSDSRKK